MLLGVDLPPCGESALRSPTDAAVVLHRVA